MTSTDIDTRSAEGRARAALRDVRNKVRDSAGMMRAKVGDLSGDARSYANVGLQRAEAMSRSAIEAARARPATSALAIFGVGLALGAVLALTLRKPTERLGQSALDGTQRLRRKVGW